MLIRLAALDVLQKRGSWELLELGGGYRHRHGFCWICPSVLALPRNGSLGLEPLLSLLSDSSSSSNSTSVHRLPTMRKKEMYQTNFSKINNNNKNNLIIIFKIQLHSRIQGKIDTRNSVAIERIYLHLYVRFDKDVFLFPHGRINSAEHRICLISVVCSWDCSIRNDKVEQVFSGVRYIVNILHLMTFWLLFSYELTSLITALFLIDRRKFHCYREQLARKMQKFWNLRMICW